MATKPRSDSQLPANPRGTPSALKPEHIAALHEILAENAQASLAEIADELDRRCGVRVCTATIRRARRAQGVVRLKATRRVSPTADKGPKRYGYTAAHRREDVPFYSTNLTDAEWDLGADLFERAPGQRGTPAQYSQRELVNARSYVRTGCAWWLLSTTFPPWQADYKTFARWAAAGVFESMQDRLREQWRLRMERTDAPTAAVIDAQSNRSSPQGGETGFDAGKRIKGRKRNLVVDTMGLVIAMAVTAASVQDRDAVAVVAQACAKAPGLQKLYTDGAYGGTFARDPEQRHHVCVEVVRRPGNGTTGTLHNAAQMTTPDAEINRAFGPCQTLRC